NSTHRGRSPSTTPNSSDSAATQTLCVHTCAANELAAYWEQECWNACRTSFDTWDGASSAAGTGGDLETHQPLTHATSSDPAAVPRRDHGRRSATAGNEPRASRPPSPHPGALAPTTAACERASRLESAATRTGSWPADRTVDRCVVVCWYRAPRSSTSAP